jgi:ketosteroid isomerase-like protein
VSGTDGLEARLRALEDQQAIMRRLHLYGHSLDYGERDVWLECFTGDALLEWPHGTFVGSREIARAFDEHSHAPETVHKHVVVDPVIDVDGDRALVRSYFARLDERPGGPIIRSIGRYRDVLVRSGDGDWRFEERRTDLESRIVLGE